MDGVKETLVAVRAQRSSMQRLVIGASTLLLLGGLVAYTYSAALIPWIEGKGQLDFVEVSGNIEAHESILSFKTVQSRIVELPFDEGQSVKKGTLLARVDDADYKQQVVIAEAALNARGNSSMSPSRTSTRRARRWSATKPTLR